MTAAARGEDIATPGPIVWHGKRVTFAADYEERRLYVCQRFGRMQAWIDGHKVGDFDSIKAAMVAAEKSLHPRPQAGSRVYVTPDMPPLADMTKPPPVGVITSTLDKPSPVAAVSVWRRCKCGAAFGRSGKCPALCQPLQMPLPKYDGPAIIGTRIGPLPVPFGPDWIG